MKARPTWVRKLYWTLAIGAVFGMLMMAYGYFQITAEVDSGIFKKPNVLDAQEADRKLKLYNEALAISRRGFVRLSEVEINSYLLQHYFSDGKIAGTNAPPANIKLLTSRLGFTQRGVKWYCWVRKKWLGRPVDLVWERALELNRIENRWVFQTTSMRLGKMAMPARWWPLVQSQIGEIDLTFDEPLNWLTKLPTLEIKTNAASSSPELRLYTYQVSETWTGAKP
jgi:hypothetical protein